MCAAMSVWRDVRTNAEPMEAGGVGARVIGGCELPAIGAGK